MNGEASRQSQVNEELQNISKTISYLTESITALEERLKRCLLVESPIPIPVNSNVTKADTPLVPLADEIREYARTLTNLNGRVSSIIQRIEL